VDPCWHAHRHSSGSGPVYQGRSKSFPVQTDEHFLTVARYVERNALRAGLVGRAEYWQWSSLYRFLRADGKTADFLNEWPMERPKDWIEFVNGSERESELDKVRSSAQGGRPFGNEDWVIKVAKQLGLESTNEFPWSSETLLKRLPTPFPLPGGAKSFRQQGLRAKGYDPMAWD
jgi:putative transposase